MSLISEIKKEILSKPDLDINEKMCLLSLMCIGEPTDYIELSVYMGCTENTAKMAFLSLKQKGYFSENPPVKEEEEIQALKKLLQKDAPKSDGNVIKAAPSTSASMDSSEEKKDKVDEVMALLDEVVTRSEATILLGFADGNVDRIEAVYSRIRGSQVEDKVSALANMLQSTDETSLTKQSKILAYKRLDGQNKKTK